MHLQQFAVSPLTAFFSAEVDKISDAESCRCVEAGLSCWEFMSCGFEEGGANAALHGVCPAYPNHGRSCVALPRTMCNLINNELAGAFPLQNDRQNFCAVRLQFF